MQRNVLIALVALLVIGGGVYWANATGVQGPLTNMMGSTNSGENPEPGSAVHDLPVEPAAAAARADLAAKLGVLEKNIVIMRVEDATWNDGCLGLGGPAESCMMALVEGFKVEMKAKGATYVYRTDKTGASLRME